MPTSTELRQNAEAKFKKREIQRLDGCAAMAEYEAANRATVEKTERLRALRLSHDAAATSTSKSEEKPRRKTRKRS